MAGAAQTPVAIVGGGPVGLVLALLLDAQGVPSVVCDEGDSSFGHPGGTRTTRAPWNTTGGSASPTGCVPSGSLVSIPPTSPTSPATAVSNWPGCRCRRAWRRAARSPAPRRRTRCPNRCTAPTRCTSNGSWSSTPAPGPGSACATAAGSRRCSPTRTG
ncbi:hypothetical protein GXW82_13065 [Streptacidiphilus sp. 4-A2]|nr:hypothetical protein [Streptacidiphilus sp. 4-A2]